MRIALDIRLAVGWLMALGGCTGPSQGSVGPPMTVSEARPTRQELRRVTTVAPFPRGLAMVDGRLYVLCRGRVRGAGGVSAEIADQAGTVYVVDPAVSEPASRAVVGEAVRNNGRVFARPTDPPFHLWDRRARPPESDRLTDRPYCTLRFHEPTQSFYLCAFSGIDQPKKPGEVSFSKNLTDGLLRYDLRTRRWHEVERHDIAAGGSYPHHDVRVNPAPHGWLNGPDNCLVVGNWLYAVAKDNSVLVRYDLSALMADPHAGPPDSKLVLGERIRVAGRRVREFRGHSALAEHDGWLYLGCRTSSVILRIQLDGAGAPVEPTVAELVARFEPYDPKLRHWNRPTSRTWISTLGGACTSCRPSRRVLTVLHRTRGMCSTAGAPSLGRTLLT